MAFTMELQNFTFYIDYKCKYPYNKIRCLTYSDDIHGPGVVSKWS